MLARCTEERPLFASTFVSLVSFRHSTQAMLPPPHTPFPLFSLIFRREPLTLPPPPSFPLPLPLPAAGMSRARRTGAPAVSTEGVNEEEINTLACIREFREELAVVHEGDEESKTPATMVETARAAGVDQMVLTAMERGKVGGLGGEGGSVDDRKIVIVC